jgi:hypothetical protein
MSAREHGAAGVNQFLENRRGVVLGCIDQNSAGRIPSRTFEGGPTTVIDRVASLCQPINRRHNTRSDGQTVLELPEQRLDSAGTEVRRREIQRRLILELRMR